VQYSIKPAPFRTLLSKYSGFFLNAAKQSFAYRVSTIVWTVYPFFFLLISYFLWSGIFESAGGTLLGMELERYLAFIGIAAIGSRLTFCSRESTIAHDFKEGTVAIALTKPYSYQLMNLAQHLGVKLVNTVQSLPLFIAVAALTGLSLVNGETMAAWLASLFLSFVLQFQFAFFFGVVAFWSTNVWGLHLFRWSLRSLFAGEMIALVLYFRIAEQGVALQQTPLAFLDTAFTKGLFLVLGVAAYCLPFQAMSWTPAGIWSGMIHSGSPVLLHLAGQLAWIVFFQFINRALWAKALKRMTVFGG
jgi:ABC-2 type transport system permease protein